jgi:hypothetical protein
MPNKTRGEIEKNERLRIAKKARQLRRKLKDLMDEMA